MAPRDRTRPIGQTAFSSVQIHSRVNLTLSPMCQGNKVFTLITKQSYLENDVISGDLVKIKKNCDFKSLLRSWPGRQTSMAPAEIGAGRGELERLLKCSFPVWSEESANFAEFK